MPYSLDSGLLSWIWCVGCRDAIKGVRFGSWMLGFRAWALWITGYDSQRALDGFTSVVTSGAQNFEEG